MSALISATGRLPHKSCLWATTKRGLLFSSWPRYNSSSSSSHEAAPQDDALSDEDAAAALRRQRKTEWKRRQGGQSFLDQLIVTVRGGKGGNGCAAFHREKFISYGPPCGGNGGRGGDVYILPTKHLTSLSSVPKKVKGVPGGPGSGTWQNGRSGEPTVLKVPLGTVVRELEWNDTRRAQDEWEAEDEALEHLEPDDRLPKMRERRWLHYPGAAEDNAERDSFVEAEKAMYKEERRRKMESRKRALDPLLLDLDRLETVEQHVDAPLGIKHTEYLGHLIATGGAGGLGNPHFITSDCRSPKYATRGQEGERRTFFLELKLIADVGLVGMPNAGKSTLLRSLTGGRVKTEVASYAFTTLNPVVGVVRVADDGTFEGGIQSGMVFEETLIEEAKLDAKIRGLPSAYEDSPSPLAEPTPRDLRAGHDFDLVESFRFTIADNPGLISRASENIGLGHSFLRSMERSLALAYVVDFSGPAPWDELRVLRQELENYQAGMSRKARIVIANKADLLAEDGDPIAVEAAKTKLQRLQDFVGTEMSLFNDIPKGAKRYLDVVPTSAKFSQNMKKVVGLMRTYVEEARSATAAHPSDGDR